MAPAPLGLFFDGGSNIGWCAMRYTVDYPLVAKGTIRTASAGRGIWGWRFHTIDKAVEALVARYQPVAIGFEAPWTPRLGGDNAAPGADPMAARFLNCICGKFEEVAARHGLDCSEVNSATAKKILTGSGRLKGATTKERKQKMIAACEARGWLVADEHQADAIAVAMVCVDNALRGR